MSSTDWRLITAGGIRYKLLDVTISGDEERTSATESYIIDAANLAAFYAESFPPPILFGNFFVLPPRRRMPGTSFLITKSIDFKGLSSDLPVDPLLTDPTAPADTYQDLMVVTIQYETMQESDDNQRDENKPETFLEHSVSTGGEFLSIPPTKTESKDEDVEGNRKYPNQPAAAAVKVNRDAVMPVLKTIPTVEHQLKWKYALNPDWATIYKQLGTVNDRALPFFNDAKPETVLFTGISGQRQYVWNGASARVQPWSLDFKFSQRYVTDVDERGGERFIGWNHAWVPDRKGWMRIILNPDTGEELYKLSDFRDLFKAG